MSSPATPFDPNRIRTRLAALRRLGGPEVVGDADLDSIARAAAEALDLPFASISLVDDESERILASHGLKCESIPGAASIAADAVGDGVSQARGDLAADPRFSANPFVAQGARFATVEPIKDVSHTAVGAIVGYAREARALSSAQRHTLADLAHQAAAVLETRAYTRDLRTPPPIPVDAEREAKLRETSSFPTVGRLATPVRPERTRRSRLPWVVAGGLALTAILTGLSQRSALSTQKRLLVDAALRLESSARSDVAAIRDGLQMGSQFLGIEDRIPRRWPQMLMSLNQASRKRLSVGYAAAVPMAEAPAFEQAARERIGQRFSIKPRGARPLAAPVLFFDPPLVDADVIGFDVLTDAALAGAVEDARDSADARLTRRTSFGRTRGAGSGVILVIPIYDATPAPETVEARRSAIRGWLLTPIASSSLLRGWDAGDSQTGAAALYEGDSPSYETLLHSSSPQAALPTGGALSRPIDLAGRRFSLVVAPKRTGAGHWMGAVAFWIPALSGLLATLFGALKVKSDERSRGALSALSRERQALRDNDTRVRALVDHVVDGIITYDAEGSIQTFNRAAEKMFGYGLSAIIGGKIEHLLPRGGVENHRIAGHTEVSGLRANGARFVAQVSVAPLVSTGERLYVAVVSDITDRKIAERHLAAQNALTRILADSPTLEDAAPSILRAVGQGIECVAGALWLVDREASGLRRFAEWTRTPQDERTLRAAGADPVLPPGRGLPGRVWITGQASRVIDQRLLGEDDHATRLLAVRLALPLLGKTEVVGVMEYVTPRVDSEMSQLEPILNIVGREVGPFIERKQTEAALVESEARYRDLFETVNDLIQSAHVDGSIQFANRAWRATLGYTDDDLRNMRVQDALAASSRDAYERALESAARRDGTPVPVDLVFTSKDGAEIVTEGSLAVRSARGEVSVLGIFRNATAQREVERLKQQFVSTVSHELRTPLASIQGSLGLLKAGALGELPQDAQEVATIAERNVVRLIDLINDILDLDRLQSGRLEIVLAPVEIATIVHRSVEAVAGFAQQQKIRLTLGPKEGSVFGDAERLVQVMVNLLSNAAKFSPPGSTVTVTAAESSGWVRVEVKDQGPGIPAAYHDAVFERFRQVATPSRSKGGTGLGLAICKAIVEEHGGTIGVDSREGAGSVFWFRVPATSVSLDARPRHEDARA